jgi:hypothetical protein
LFDFLLEFMRELVGDVWIWVAWAGLELDARGTCHSAAWGSEGDLWKSGENRGHEEAVAQ